MPRLVHTGSVIVDKVMTVPKMPEPGGDVVVTSAKSVVGGGFNTIVASVRDGLPVLYAGLMGTGENADRVRAALEQHGVEIALEPTAEVDTGHCVAIVEDSAERTFFTHIGAEGLEGIEHLSQLQLRPDDLVYVTGYSLASEKNAEGLREWLATLPSEVMVFADPSPLVTELPAETVQPLLDRADVFSPNARETRYLGGDEDFLTAAANLRRRLPYSAALVARDGAAGAWVSRHGSDPGAWVPGFPVEAVDTNGAGDAHAGVLMAALSRGEDLLAAVKRANAAGALAVTKRGPATSPDGPVIDAFLAARNTSA